VSVLVSLFVDVVGVVGADGVVVVGGVVVVWLVGALVSSYGGRGRPGDREAGRLGDRETGRPRVTAGDRETGRLGDPETGRPGDRGAIAYIIPPGALQRPPGHWSAAPPAPRDHCSATPGHCSAPRGIAAAPWPPRWGPYHWGGGTVDLRPARIYIYIYIYI
jgi:hypothetical protein